MSLCKAAEEADELILIAVIIGIFLTRNSKTEEDAIILGNFLSYIGDTMITQISQQRALRTLLTGVPPLTPETKPILEPKRI